MFSAIRYSVLACVLATTSLAQSSPYSDSQSLTCDDLSEGLAYNASVTLNTTALNFGYLGDNDGVIIREEDSAIWQISSYVGPAYNGDAEVQSENKTQVVLWLDTKDTSMERLGDHIGLCHNYVPLQNRTTGNLTWSRKVLERAQDDSGDCKTMLGDECVAALENWYSGQGLSVWSTKKDPACNIMKNTIPFECEGMLSEAVTMDALPFNISTKDRIWKWNQGINLTSYSNDVTVPTCGDRNLSSSWGNRIYDTTDYDLALNFPIVDILMFYPTVPLTKRLANWSTHTKVVCLKPENAQEGSRAPRTAKEVLDANFGLKDDESSAERGFGWSGKAALASVVGMVVGVWLGL